MPQIGWLLRWIAGATIVCTLTAAAGTGVARPAESPLQQAIENALEAGSASVDMAISFSTEGKPYPLKLKGAFDFRHNRGSFALDLGKLLTSPGVDTSGVSAPPKLTVVLIDNVVYVHVPTLSKDNPGKEWLKLDPETIPKNVSSGADISGFASLSPASALKALRGAYEVKALGTQTVGGEPMARYHAVVDATRLSGAAPAAERAQIRLFLTKLGLTKVTLDALVDKRGYLRRITTLPMKMNQTAGTKPSTFSVEMVLSGYGRKVTVNVPPAGKTVDLGKALAGTGQTTTTTTTTTTSGGTTTTPVGSVRPAMTLLEGSTVLGPSIAAPKAANGLSANFTRQTGAITSAFWLKDGKWLAEIAVPSGANALVFRTSPNANPDTTVVRPQAATGLKIAWDVAGTITAATWSRVGKPLGPVTLPTGARAVAITGVSG